MRDALGRLGKILGVGILLFSSQSIASPPVNVALTSSWPSPDFLLEIIESAVAEHPNDYFSIFDAIVSSDDVHYTPQSKVETYLDVLGLLNMRGFLLETGVLQSLDASLAVHASSPKLEAYFRYYDQLEIPSVDNEVKCASWVLWQNQRVCDLKTLGQLTSAPQLANETSASPKLLSFDRVQPDPSRTLHTPNRTAILYASLGSKNLRVLHRHLHRLSKSPSPALNYVIRYVSPSPSTRATSPRAYLSGYGVALDLKKMDYLAVDDRRARSDGTKHATSSTEVVKDPILDLLDNIGKENVQDEPNPPLTETEFLELSQKSSQLIISSEDPLDTLIDLSQNFPRYATAVSRRLELNANFSDELAHNALELQNGASAMWINGKPLQAGDMNPFSLLRILRKERQTISALSKIGLPPAQAVQLLSFGSPPPATASQSSVLEGIFDASDRRELRKLIVWWNDLEKDTRYKTWPTTLKALLRPAYPGQPHTVGKNIANIVLVLDMSSPSRLVWVTDVVSNIIQRNYPLRMGLVPIIESEDAEKMARLLYYCVENYGRGRTIAFLKPLANSKHTSIDFALARTQFEELINSRPPSNEGVTTNFEEVITSYRGDILDLVKGYNKRLSNTLLSSSMGHGYVNGKHFDLTDDFFTNMQTEGSLQIRYLQEELYYGRLTDENAGEMANYFYDRPSSSARRNTHVVPSTATLRIQSLPELFGDNGVKDMVDAFVYPPNEELITKSLWIVGDLEHPPTLALLREGLNSVGGDSNFRLSYIHVHHDPSAISNSPNVSVSTILFHLVQSRTLDTLSATELLTILDYLSPNPVAPKVLTDAFNKQIVFSAESPVYNLLGADATEKIDMKAFNAYCQATALLAKNLGLTLDNAMILINGRVVGPIEPGGFVADDFDSLVRFEHTKRTGPMLNGFGSLYSDLSTFDRKTLANLVTMASSIIDSVNIPEASGAGLFNSPPLGRARQYEVLHGEHTSFTIGHNETSLFHIGVVLNPISEVGQKWSSLLKWLTGLKSVYIRVYLNPSLGINELPVKRFYRYNVQSRLPFDKMGNEIPQVVNFEGLPPDPIYTLGMDLPSSWLARPHESEHDLDNIHLSSLTEAEYADGVKAIFRLDHLVIEGHARESRETPPRGLQLQLSNLDGSIVADTQVVANLGYLQFKAGPGVFQLGIREGRGRQMYEMESVGNEGWNSPTVAETGVDVTVTNFEGLTIYPRFRKRPGQEEADVLDDSAEQKEGSVLSDFWSKLSHVFQPKADKKAVAPKQADINIFTVASGMLYERFASIMILSVMRNTKSTVKFWFIENFLSPSFLEFIPHLAETYNFQYELVTYKWPSWLRAQKEKQRIIWAYKILFLDVLFPMDLKKVIFVDADQIVRADLQELVDLDLQGAPYGYTPMGDDNEDMEGFRFWKTGYWKDALLGKPYHISALYVIDLVRFRQLAAGDRLRAQYQSLSADPNSLANLDQDLPNNLQHDVPIFSLDKNWLWCETWCSKDRLHLAKTIDLCQNPLTKEPKLSRARAIPEWSEYDAEVAKLAQKLADEGKLRSSAAAGSVDGLANVGSSAKSGEVKEAEAVVEEEDAEKEKEERVKDEL